MMVDEKKRYALTSKKTNGTKCLRTLIRHHGLDVKSRKSIWALAVVCSSFSSFVAWLIVKL
jgi:hypothetical protein